MVKAIKMTTQKPKTNREKYWEIIFDRKGIFKVHNGDSAQEKKRSTKICILFRHH